MKQCGTCWVVKPVTEFAKNSSKKDGLQERCKECRAKHHQNTKHLRPKPTSETKRKGMLKYKYGITPAHVDALLMAQNGVCAVCKTSNWGRPTPCVDHCHTTGKVRGLLCNTCNRALGLLKDDTELLKSAIAYLERSHG